MEDQGQPDHKILGVPDGDPLWQHARDLNDIPDHTLRELEHFFAIYKDLEDKKTAAIGWQPAAVAIDVVTEARQRYS